LGNIAGPLAGGALWDKRGDKAPFFLSIIVEGCLALIYPIVITIISRRINQRKKRSEQEKKE